MLFFSNPGSKFTPSSNRVVTGEKLRITSSVTKDVYMFPGISYIFLAFAPYANIYVLNLVYFDG